MNAAAAEAARQRRGSRRGGKAQSANWHESQRLEAQAPREGFEAAVGEEAGEKAGVGEGQRCGVRSPPSGKAAKHFTGSVAVH
ncbi:hypothetical protein [Amycolatopsis sp. FDAARGOS 1241]|uniref:hypothetical protein n=1 Tax=Amycolatopsis sp. FDAARGOS 1241 TaxID=2778070 RepID=UPI00194DD229|nr:hypothetical protein [Amycolatopsis sp. FDAARGOS 1241]QRP47305.1 hypothetical protein I6J71_04720 [Amycolatopsis sp. FDAARGOS 1241]